MAKKSKSAARLGRSVRSQQAQQKRISKMIGQLEMKGFIFPEKFKLSIMNTVKSTASNAQRKAKQLKGLTLSKLYEHASGYRTSSGKVWSGQFGVKRGRLTERRKTARDKQNKLTGLSNVEDALNNTDDHVAIDSDGKFIERRGYIDKTAERSSVLSEFDTWKRNHPKTKDITNDDLSNLEKVKGLAEKMNYLSTSETYDSASQKIISILRGMPLSADEVPEDDEELELTGVNE